MVAKAAKTAQDKRQEILQTLAPKYDKVLKDLIQIDQIDMILASALQYANDKHDITRRVVEKLTKRETKPDPKKQRLIRPWGLQS